MFWKKIKHKIRVGLKVLHDGGVANFIAVCLEFVAKIVRRLGKQQEVVGKQQSGPIYTCVKYDDAIRADFHSSQRQYVKAATATLTFNWLMPPPGKGSGGHINIFRFIRFLEQAGHTCRIYLYSQHGKSRISDIRALMGDSYPIVNASMQWLDDEMEPADGIFATSWETAYASFNSALPAQRFYFVQDFEPYFYPMGSLYTLAENSYKFGFYGITAGGWLSQKLKADYGMNTDHFDFGSDADVYQRTNGAKRNEIVFYARPYTERRGFEIGVLALDLFHQMHPDVVINMVGYDVSNYKLPFPYKNLKTLEVNQLSDLYNKCAAALVLSFTNMSLLPLELLSCGTIPVVNDAANNRLVSNNPYIAYSENDPVSLAKALSNIINRADLPEYSLIASQSVKQNTWEESGHKFVAIVERETCK